MCNAIPILSFFFLYHPYIPHSLILFSSILSFLCMHAYIKSSGFIRGKGPRSTKRIAILPDNVIIGLRVCAKFHDHTYAHSKVQGNITKHIPFDHKWL